MLTAEITLWSPAFPGPIARRVSIEREASLFKAHAQLDIRAGAHHYTIAATVNAAEDVARQARQCYPCFSLPRRRVSACAGPMASARLALLVRPACATGASGSRRTSGST